MEGAKQLIDNEHVTVWDVTLEKGKATLLQRHRMDTVLVALEELQAAPAR